MKAAGFIFILLAAVALVFPAPVTYKSPLASVESIFNSTGMPSLSSFTSLFGMGNTTMSADSVKQVAGALGGASSGNLSGLAGIAGAAGAAALPSLPKVPTVTIPLSQLRIIGALVIVLFYIFAAGKIADFLQSTGRRITKREALFAPFAMMFVSLAAIALYFISGAYHPPQDTLITNVVYLLLVPAAITLGLGSLVLYGFFHDRLNYLQSLDLSIHIVLSPVFDGIKGYWTALGAGVILSIISAIVFYSSGGRLALVTFDFLLMAIIVSLYYLYRFFTVPGNENKAGNAVMILCLLAPSIMQRYLKDAVCSVLVHLPFGLFSTCPLDSVGSDVTLAVSIGATMLLLVPVVPILYAFVVNVLRAYTLAALLLKQEPKPLKIVGAGAPGEGKPFGAWGDKSQDKTIEKDEAAGADESEEGDAEAEKKQVEAAMAAAKAEEAAKAEAEEEAKAEEDAAAAKAEAETDAAGSKDSVDGGGAAKPPSGATPASKPRAKKKKRK